MNIQNDYNETIRNPEIEIFNVDTLINTANDICPYNGFYYAVNNDNLIVVSFHIVSVWRLESNELIRTYVKHEIDDFKNDFADLTFVNELSPDCDSHTFHQKYDVIIRLMPMLTEYEFASPFFDFNKLANISSATSVPLSY